MSETPFFKTAMGREFYDRSMPTLVKELQRLNDNIATFVTAMQAMRVDYTKIAQAILDSPIKLPPSPEPYAHHAGDKGEDI